MQQTLVLKPISTQTTSAKLTIGTPEIDMLFPGFKPGDFAVIYGAQSVNGLVARLCLRAQSQKSMVEVENKIIFIDGANSSSMPSIVQEAEFRRIEPKTVLRNVINMRVYTAYRLTSLIMEKLEESLETSSSKLVIISDIVGPFLSDNVNDQEAKAVYSQIMSYLANIAKKHRIVVIATYLSHENSARNVMLQEISTAKANVVLRFTKTPYTSEVELEKHASYILGIAEFSPEIKTLSDFPIIANEQLELALC